MDTMCVACLALEVGGSSGEWAMEAAAAAGRAFTMAPRVMCPLWPPIRYASGSDYTQEEDGSWMPATSLSMSSVCQKKSLSWRVWDAKPACPLP